MQCQLNRFIRQRGRERDRKGDIYAHTSSRFRDIAHRIMFHLPPPPRFVLPPPPMPGSDLFDLNLLTQLTCSSIRQRHQQITNPRLILISCLTFLILALLLTLLVIVIQFSRQRNAATHSNKSKPSPPNATSVASSRSYETISSQHTGIYLESIDTSATTYSTDPSQHVCLQCQHDREQSSISPPPYYHTLDILPS